MTKLKQLWVKSLAIFWSLPVVLLLMTMSGCASTLPVVEPAPSCSAQLDPKILNEACLTATDLPPGVLYDSALHDDKNVRTALKACAVKTAALQASAKNCEDLINRHNKALQVINK